MNERLYNITISSGAIFKFFLILALFALIFVLRDLVLILLTAVVIASSIEPATRFFEKHNIPRVLGVIVVYIFLILGLVGLFYAFVPVLISEISKAASVIPQYVGSLEMFYSPNDIVGINPQEAQSLANNISQTFSITDSFSNLQGILQQFSSGAFQTVTRVFGGVFSFVLIFVISFYLAVQERGIENFLKMIVPLKHEKYVIDLWQRSQNKIGKWMQGQLLLGVIIGVLVYLGLTILGIPYALTLALLAAIAELIPIFGPIFAAVPAVALGFTDSFALGLIVIGFYIIIQQFESHLIYPLVVRKVVGVHPLLVIIALIVGAKLAGFLGMLLAVPVAAALMEFADDVQKEKHKDDVPNAAS